ncbi:hypothetical protein BV22DRAFT_1083645 [Leucogyrophana mollusca]|uniref:Uncharacterized protein n=1 Tax=Leucogyrophana mollusca TaxID=85980 RepID=A0ACB8BRE5_9AGAM|nr:hypothetical protein BV22DRAFT_1083645 [Leucogyrophana mollusca]
MENDPNFPMGLQISPSTPNHGSTSTRANILPCNGDVAFGSAAQQLSIQKYGIAGRVWEAAYAIIAYINRDASWDFDPPFVYEQSSTPRRVFIELGSGTGIVAARISDSGALRTRDLLFVTDLPEVCPLLENNLRDQLNATASSSLSSNGSVTVRPLAWGNYEHALQIARDLGLDSECDGSDPRHLTHIICSDLVYFPELLAPLLRTLIHLTSLPFGLPSEEGSVQIVISYKVRSLAKETAFWSAFGLWFTFVPVVARRRTSQEQTEWERFGSNGGDQVFIFIAHRRPESHAWEVPRDDQDLIDGVGAKGTVNRKGDDTFETLLLMDLAGDEEIMV